MRLFYMGPKGQDKFPGGVLKMIRIFTFAAMLAMAMLTVLACSQITPMEPRPQGASFCPDEHMLWGYYHLYIDPSGPSVEVVPAKHVMVHKNVKQYLIPPACPDCITIAPTGPYQNSILPLDISLKNPTPLTGYDVRGILLSDDPGAGLVNPDNYTGLFDNGGDVNINPFKAYAKLEDKRKFGAGESYAEHYELYLSKFGKCMKIDYAIDASWPGRAKEPYQIGLPMIIGELDTLGLNTATIEVTVLAAGDDVDEVLADFSSLGFTEDLEFQYIAGSNWELELQNTHLVGVGDYLCLIKASTSSSELYLYSYFYITVVEGIVPVSLQDDVQPILNSYCITCHQSIAPPQELDLTEGNTYSNTVDVDSGQSSVKRVTPGTALMSYLVAKLIGIHELPPFNGSGDRMAKDGSYLGDEEQQTIMTWIEQGALDN
jgi:hypothetical protein